MEASSALALTRPQVVAAHLALHAARIDSVATRNNPFLKNLVEDCLVEDFSLLRVIISGSGSDVPELPHFREDLVGSLGIARRVQGSAAGGDAEWLALVC